jgi:hypothetical protein
MPVTYTNRKGSTYTLCRTTTKSGKPRYAFVRDPTGRAVMDALPEGWEIRESLNGVVSLAQAREQHLLPEEIAAVRAALDAHPRAHNYRLDVKPERLVIYEGEGPDLEELLNLFGANFGLTPGKRQELRGELAQRGRFTPILRFILNDTETRDFRADRWCFRGRIDDWIFVDSGQLADLAPRLVPKLGTEAFLDLY